MELLRFLYCKLKKICGDREIILRAGCQIIMKRLPYNIYKSPVIPMSFRRNVRKTAAIKIIIRNAEKKNKQKLEKSGLEI